VWSAVLLTPAILCAWPQPAHAEGLDTREKLGETLFSDRNLSFSRKQNCMSCHSPELAFTDPRVLGELQGAVSRGGDGHSFGDRNSPTLRYISTTPSFHISADREAAGGFFWDGRARTLEDQVRDPIVNPVEMAMPDDASIASRLRENDDYRAAFAALYGDDALSGTPKAIAALKSALAAFLRTPEFSPFDSRYDRSLRGEAALSETETQGRDIFFSKEGAGCHRCHSSAAAGARADLFTDFRYFNLGVPRNAVARRLNKSKAQHVDHGLMENPATAGVEFDGKFKVPTLRNIAITGPYMHNGVFQDLRTAILFHLRFSGSAITATNPETGSGWDAPEVAVNVAAAELRAPALIDADVDALIAFLKTLTDRNYENLLAN
jgi:cytochrome c peroxidase